MLRAVAEALVPSLDVEGDGEVPAFLRRGFDDLRGAMPLLERAVGPRFDPLLEQLEATEFLTGDAVRRPEILVELGAAGGETRQLFRELKAAVMGLFYGLPDAHGRNPSWPALGFPGPVTSPPSAEQAPKTIRVEELQGPDGAAER